MNYGRQSFAFRFSFLNCINRSGLSDAEFRALINACTAYASNGIVTEFDDRLLSTLFMEFCSYDDFCYQRWCNANRID